MRLSVVAVTLVTAACGKSDSHAAKDSAADRVADQSVASTDSGGVANRAGNLIIVPAEQRARLRVQPVTIANFRPTLQTTGTVAFDADVSTQVLAPVSGPVTRILVQPGSYVQRGTALALVSSPDFAAAVAAFRKANGAAAQARRNADLDEQLFKNDAIARRDVEQAQIDAQAAEADREAALQQLRSLAVDEPTIDALRSNKTVGALSGAIRAPIAGTVVEKLINPGQLLQAGSTPAFTIADLSTMWVEASVFERDLAMVRVGDGADVTTGASTTPIRGRVAYIAAEVDPSTKATAVRVVVPNPRGLLKKDMYVQVALHASSEEHGILIPVSAVLRDEQNLPFVFVEAPGGGFARRQITVGSRVGDQFDVHAGLKEGDRIIAEGGLFIQFAQSQ
jgi:cobalt-zinc-cadmium efflux system membrane fusion protein